MKKVHPLSLFVAVVIAIAVVPLAQAEPMAPDCAKERFLDELSVGTSRATADAEPLFLAKPAKGRKSSTMSPSGSGGNSLAACEWFIIECNAGGGDVCCGSVSSCLGYCEEICGPPCVYVE